MAESLFGNIFDVDADIQSAREKSALSMAALPRGRVQVAGASMAGGMLGKAGMEGLGYKSPRQQKEEAVLKVQAQFPNPQTSEEFRQIGNALMNIDPDRAKMAFDMAEDMNPNSATSDMSNLGKHYKDALLIEGCKPGDVACEERARKLMFRFKKPENAVSGKLGGWAGTKLGESRDTAEKSIASIRTIGRANRLLNKGITTGSFSGSRNSVARFFNTLGWTEDESVGATDEYLATLGYLVKDILGSGDFGAGTGLSDKDVEFVMRMIGSDTDIDEASLRRILNISERAHRETITRHNDFSSQFDSDMPDRAGLKGFKFNLKMPDWSTGGPAGEGAVEVEYSDADQAMFEEDGI